MAIRLHTWHFLFLLFTAACSGPEDAPEALLQQPPFDKLTDSIQNAPEAPDLYYRRGILLYRNNQPAFAQRDLQRAWSIAPKENYALSLATVLQQKSADSAIRFLETAKDRLPGSLGVQMALARGYEGKGAAEKALQICNGVLAAYPNQLDALILKSEILKESGKEEEALKTLETAYSYAPFDAELSHSLAFEYAESKNPKALLLADSLIKADVAKAHAEPYYFKGVYYANTGNTAAAITQFDEAIRHDYNFLDAHMDKGRTLLDAGNPKAALQSFGLAARITPSFADAYYWMGKCEEALGNKAEAKQLYGQAYALDKNLQEAREAAGRL